MSQSVTVWKVIPVNERSDMHKDDALDTAVRHGRIFIGWGDIGDIVKKRLGTAEDMELALRKFYPNGTNIANGIRALINFAEIMQVGDLVIVVGRSKSIVAEITKDYEYKDSTVYGMPAGYDHQREIRVLSSDSSDIANVVNLCGDFQLSQYVTVRPSKRKIDVASIEWHK